MRMSDKQCAAHLLPFCCILRLISYRQSAALGKDVSLFLISFSKTSASSGMRDFDCND